MNRLLRFGGLPEGEQTGIVSVLIPDYFPAENPQIEAGITLGVVLLIGNNMQLQKHNLEFHKLITADGVEYAINTNTTRFSWGHFGEGMVKAKIRTQRAPFQDGVSPVDFRYESRMITMTMRINNKNIYDYHSIRESLINTFRINRNTTHGLMEPATLRKLQPNGDIRDILVFIDMGFLFKTDSEGTWSDFGIQETIRFFAPSPFYYDPNKVVSGLQFDAVTDLIFPVEGPIEFGGASAETDSVNYRGNVKSYPILEFVGPARNPIIINLITGSKIELDYIIPAGNTITVDISPVALNIVDDGGIDLRGILTSDSDPEFAVVPSPLAPSGVNSFACAATSTTALTKFNIIYFNRYQGI